MYYEEEDYDYYEPSEFDKIANEFTGRMKDAIKQNIKYHYEQIEEENDRLKEENNKLKERSYEVDNKEKQLEYQKSDLMRQVKRERLSKLLEDFQVVMYRAYNTTVKLPKCDKCNDQRKIEFLSPSGKKMYEDCKCNIGKVVYVPYEYICKEFRADSNSGKMLMWFKENHEEDYDWCGYESSNLVKTVYKDGMNYDELDYYNTYFKTKDECQKYCDWINQKEIIIPTSSPSGKKLKQ